MATVKLKLPVSGGGDDPALVAKQRTLNSGDNPLLNLVEARDIISNQIKGDNADTKGDFLRLSQLIGQDKAQKLFTRLALYNQDSSVKSLSYLDRVRRFYDSDHSSDAEMADYINRIKGLGYGPTEGAINSRYAGTQNAAGNILLRIAQK